jgi:hypothetical protein
VLAAALAKAGIAFGAAIHANVTKAGPRVHGVDSMSEGPLGRVW